MTAELFAAERFDGRYAVAVPTWVCIEDGYLAVRSVDERPLDRVPLVRAAIGEAFAHAPRVIVLENGVTLEVDDPDGGFARALERAGIRTSWVVRLQSRWPAAVGALAAVVAVVALAYVQGLPLAARWLAFALPSQVEARMGSNVLAALDEQVFKPSRVERKRRDQIATAFARAAVVAAPGTRYRLEFRYTAGDDVNAFALPGGIIVLLDGAVAFGDSIDPDAVLGVLGHELGHVVHKHPMRGMLQAMGVGAIANLLWGDFSGAAAGAPVLFGDLSYSRAFESEADDFGVRVLRSSQRSPQALHDFFACLELQGKRHSVPSIPTFLSTHPSHKARMARLRARGAKAATADDLGCPPD